MMENERGENYKRVRDILNSRQLENIDFPNLGLKILEESLFACQKEAKSINLNSNEIKLLDAKIFQILTGLKEVYFSSNKITQLDAGIFKKLTHLTSIDFSSNQITQLDPNLFQNIYTLKSIDFSSNKIKKLDPNLFHSLVNLSSIKFGSNQIAQLDSNIFQGLRNLTWVDFSFNRVELLASQLFNEQRDISYINFSSNQIKQLDVNLFRGKNNLTWIDFSSNQITQLDRRIFTDKKHLFLINFNSNKILKLDRDIFRNLSSLVQVDFGSNQLTNIDEGIFKSATSLQFISFGSNQITQLDANIFQGLGKLQIVDFSSNKLTHLHREIFKDVTNLSIIDFSSNQITRLDSKIFQRLSNLKIIDFSLNQIDQLDSNIFNKLSNLKTLIFSSNKLSFLPADIFNRLDNLQNVLLNSNYFSNIPSNIFKNLSKLKQINFKFDYSLLNSFSNLDYISMFDLFFTVEEGCEYDFYKNQVSQIEPTFRVSAFFEDYLTMYCLSKTSLCTWNLGLKDFDLRQCFSSHADFGVYFGKDYTPLDFLLEIESVSNKTITNILKHGEYTLNIYKFKIEHTQFKVKNIDTISYLCRRNSEQLMGELVDLFYVDDFLRCFNIAIEEDYEMVACFLFNIFVDRIISSKSFEFTLRSRKFFLSNVLGKCFAKKWWSLFKAILDYKQNIDPNNPEKSLNFYMLFENSIQQRQFYLSNKKNKSTKEECITEMANSFNQNYNVLEWNTIKNASSQHILHLIASSEQTNLIKHDTTIEYLQLKWKYLPQFIYYIHLLTFLIFLISYSINLENQHQKSSVYDVTWWLCIVIVSMFICEEIFQILFLNVVHSRKSNTILSRLVNFKNYLKSVQNVLELIVYPACLASLLFFEKTESLRVKRIVCSFIIIFLYGIFILRLEKLKLFDFNIGIYVTVFRRILYRSAKVLPLIMLASFAFLFSFRVNTRSQIDQIQAPNDTKYTFNSSFWLNFIHMMTLNLADFNNDEMGFGEQINQFNWPLYVSYLVYLFVIPILIVNIFIGISVDELKKLIDQSLEYNTIIKIDYTLRIQDVLLWIRIKFRLFARIHDCLAKFTTFSVLITKCKLTCLCSCMKFCQRNDEDYPANEQAFVKKDPDKYLDKHAQQSLMHKSELEEINKLRDKIDELNDEMEQLEKRLNNSIRINTRNLYDKIDKLDEKITVNQTKLNTDMQNRLSNILSSVEVMSRLLSNSIERVRMPFIDE